jgi:protein-S-isoprenylcysteine O-methyltransferase Ste14
MTNDLVFRAVAATLMALSLGISIVFRRRAEMANDTISPQEEGPIILNLRRFFGLALWLSSAAYLVNPRWVAWASLPLPSGLRWLGAGIMALCVPLIYWLFSSLGTNVTGTVAIRQAHTLVTHGPYRWVRHPLYSVGSTLFMGFALLAANWLIALVGIAGFVVLAMRTRIEEAKLIERFGDDYRDYMQQTGRYMPRL